ncbi:Odorant-binding protein 1a [Trichinella spiralis]|uniref:Odorant-binding protein 1a n=1 Tax=Trichinella spiralis TaxID=6334 RepID=A0ABR3KWZ8_TRISP
MSPQISDQDGAADVPENDMQLFGRFGATGWPQKFEPIFEAFSTMPALNKLKFNIWPRAGSIFTCPSQCKKLVILFVVPHHCRLSLTTVS